jgi:hypothetical protein
MLLSVSFVWVLAGRVMTAFSFARQIAESPLLKSRVCSGRLSICSLMLVSSLNSALIKYLLTRAGGGAGALAISSAMAAEAVDGYERSKKA